PSWASQLGSQERLIQRASLPSSPPSITRPELSEKKKVWNGSSGLVGWRRSASLALMRLPPYSMMRVPAGILRAANTPLPCSLERRTTCQGLEGSAAVVMNEGWKACGEAAAIISVRGARRDDVRRIHSAGGGLSGSWVSFRRRS